QLVRLVLNGGHDLRMAVTRSRHGDPGREVEEAIAVDVFDYDSAAARDDQRVGPRIGWGNELRIAFEQFLGLWTGKGGLNPGNWNMFEFPHDSLPPASTEPRREASAATVSGD